MSSNQENDDDSFILILGTSPNGTVQCNGTTVNGDTMQKSQIDDAMRNLPEDASRAFKAQFHLGESPSPASLMVASTLITDDRSTEELQKRFGELLDENVVLKETLKQNNDSMKEQFMLIASCQEDMLKTHKLHREKFDETRELVERLRKENKQLKLDLTKQSECEQTGQALNKETGENKVGPSSAVEFVTSPEDDTIYKLTAQLELVEKQRRQVIVENEKLTWQKESLEHMTDATSRERDDLKEKLKDLELKCLSIDNEHAQEVSKLNFIIDDLQKKIKQNSVVLPKEIQERDRQIQGKMSVLQNDLKKAQMRILDLENDKLEYSQHKSGMSDTVRVYTEQIQELQSRLKSVQTTVVLPKEIQERDRQIQELQGKVSVFQNELQKAQMRILDLENVKLEYSQHKSGVSDTVRVYTEQIQELQSRLKSVQTTVVLPKEIQERDRQIQELQGKVSVLQNELQKAQMRILDLENVKLEYSQHKSGVSDTVRVYNEQIQELRSRLKSVQTTVFQPVQISMGSEEGTSDPSYMSNVKLYDRTVKHLSDYLNGLVNGLTDSLVQTLMAISTVQEVKIDPNSVNQVKTSLNDVKSTLEKQHSSTVSFISNIRGTLSIFEGIFKDYNELLKKKVTSTEPKPPSVDQLTSALLARAQEVTLLQAQVAQLTMHKDEAQVLQAQLDLYKADFEAERQSREKMASDKDSLETDLRTAQKKIIELTTQLAEAQKEVTSTSTVRKTPVTRLSGTVPRPTGTVPRPTGTVPRPTGTVDRPAGAVTRPVGTAGAAARPADNSSDVAFTCPKCFVFRSNDYAKMEEHFGYCLDDF